MDRAPPDANAEVLFARLDALVSKAQSEPLSQPLAVDSAESLLQLSHKHNYNIHDALAALVGCAADDSSGERRGDDVTYKDGERGGGGEGGRREGAWGEARVASPDAPSRTHAGPVKALKRVLAKSTADYDGDVRRVVDTVRSSAYFSSIPAMIRAVDKLLGAGACVPQVLRTKDRIQKPLPSGYRDVLINLECPNTDGLVVELQVAVEVWRSAMGAASASRSASPPPDHRPTTTIQLHLEKIVALKAEAHKIYEVTRLRPALCSRPSH